MYKLYRDVNRVVFVVSSAPTTPATITAPYLSTKRSIIIYIIIGNIVSAVTTVVSRGLDNARQITRKKK